MAAPGRVAARLESVEKVWTHRLRAVVGHAPEPDDHVRADRCSAEVRRGLPVDPEASGGSAATGVRQPWLRLTSRAAASRSRPSGNRGTVAGCQP